MEPWLLLADQWEGFTQASQLPGLAVTTDHQPLPSMEGQLCWGPLYRAGLTSAGLGYPLVSCLGPLGISYKAISSWLLLVMGLEAP